MGKKESRISINKLKEIADTSVVTIPLCGADDTEIVIRPTLPLRDMLQFVEDVVSACVDEESGAYTPEVVHFAIKANVLTHYANFTLPSNVEKQYELIYNTDAVSQVLPNINKEQYDEIVCAIYDRISHARNMISATAAQQVQTITKRMEDFVNAADELFSGVDASDVGSLMKNLSTAGAVDESVLVKAVFDAQNGTSSSKDAQDETYPNDNVVLIPRQES